MDSEKSQSGPMEDQVGALKREIKSMLSCQLDSIKQREDAHDEKMVTLSMNLISQFDHRLKLIHDLVGQEIKTIRSDLSIERGELAAAHERLFDIVKAEPVKRAEIHEEYQRSLAQVKERIDDEVRTRQEILEHQGEKLGQILNTFRNEYQVGLDQNITATKEVAHGVATLRSVLEKEIQHCTAKVPDCTESLAKLDEINTLAQMSSKSDGCFEGLAPDLKQLNTFLSTEVSPTFLPEFQNQSSAQKMEVAGSEVFDFAKSLEHELQGKGSPPGVFGSSLHPILGTSVQWAPSSSPSSSHPAPPVQSNVQEGTDVHRTLLMPPSPPTPPPEVRLPQPLDIYVNAGSSTGSAPGSTEEGQGGGSMSNTKEETLNSLRSEFQNHISETLSSILGGSCSAQVVSPGDAVAQVVPAVMGMHQMGGSASPQITPRSQHLSSGQTIQASVQTIHASVVRQSTPWSPLILARTLEQASPVTVQVRDPRQNLQVAEVPSAGPRMPGSQVRRLTSRDTPRSATYVLPSAGSLGTPSVPGRSVGHVLGFGGRKPFCQGGGPV